MNAFKFQDTKFEIYILNLTAIPSYLKSNHDKSQCQVEISGNEYDVIITHLPLINNLMTKYMHIV